jgi:hypothetical protein
MRAFYLLSTLSADDENLLDATVVRYAVEYGGRVTSGTSICAHYGQESILRKCVNAHPSVDEASTFFLQKQNCITLCTHITDFNLMSMFADSMKYPLGASQEPDQSFGAAQAAANRPNEHKEQFIWNQASERHLSNPK